VEGMFGIVQRGAGAEPLVRGSAEAESFLFPK